MSIKKLTVAAVAALGLSLGAYAAAAGPVNEGAALSSAKAPSTFTLIHGHGGGHGGGPGGGPGFGFSGMSRAPAMSMGGMAFAPQARFAAVPHAGIHSFGRAGAFPGGRHAVFFHGHRGFFRHGRFFPFYGVGLWDYGYGGGSCYWNCRAAGFGPGYCSVYAYNFCY